MTKKKKISLGLSSFTHIIKQDLAYVHRPEIIDLFLEPQRVKCIVAPQCSGKHTMLSYFEACVNAGYRDKAVKDYWHDETHPILRLDTHHFKLVPNTEALKYIAQVGEIECEHPSVTLPKNLDELLRTDFTESFDDVLNKLHTHYQQPVIICLSQVSTCFHGRINQTLIEKLSAFCQSLQFDPRVKLIIATGTFDVSDKLFIKNDDVRVYDTATNHPMRRLFGLTTKDVMSLIAQRHIKAAPALVLRWLEKTTLLLYHQGEPIFQLWNALCSISDIKDEKYLSEEMIKAQYHVEYNFKNFKSMISREFDEQVKAGNPPREILMLLHQLYHKGVYVFPDSKTSTCEQLIGWRDAGFLKTTTTGRGHLLTLANDALREHFLSFIKSFTKTYKKTLRADGFPTFSLFSPADNKAVSEPTINYHRNVIS